uniref:CRAL-TRIO domain-containing protein n=1 Tax=Strombidium inclinatum TaxID=197538 RepID=A0A7S3MYH7_9SPIT
MNPDVEDLLSAAVLVQLYMVHFMEKDGVIENNVSIVNLKDLGIFNLPYAMLKNVMQTTQGQFKGRARTIICLNSPRTISIAWNTVRYFIDELTAKKVAINSGPTCKELFELADPSQVEEKFGGSAPNMTSYWPPRLPSEEFGVEIDEEAFKDLS